MTSSYHTVKVADGVLAFIAPETYGGVVSGNSLVVIDDSAVLVVDSGHFPALTRRMIADIRRVTRLPVQYLVNTHWHPDHWLGNAEYRTAFPSVTIISTAETRARILRQGPEYVKRYRDTSNIQPLRKAATPGEQSTAEDQRYYTATLPDAESAFAEWRDARVAVPDLAFDRELVLHLGGRDAHVLFLATADLVVSPTPYAYGSFMSEWIEVLNRMKAMHPAAFNAER